eukprot:1374252-Amphidinium_carterae.1
MSIKASDRHAGIAPFHLAIGDIPALQAALGAAESLDEVLVQEELEMKLLGAANKNREREPRPSLTQQLGDDITQKVQKHRGVHQMLNVHHTTAYSIPSFILPTSYVIHQH